MVQPLIIGHRGASRVAPENTIAAFKRALDAKADGIEFDVRLALDGVPVVIHDASLKRTAQVACRVSEASSAGLQALDAGSWFNTKYPAFARSEYSQECVPTLKQLFETLAQVPALLYLEMKSDSRQRQPLATTVVELVNRHALRHRVIIESFDLKALTVVKRLDSRIRTAALFEPKRRPVALVRKSGLPRLARDCGADEIALHHSLVNRRVVEQAQRYKLEVVVWTVDDPSWIPRAATLGIKALITNDPASMVRHR